ncbi:hypothetical protein ABZY14_29885 [Streptomyces sp. NPDC006617]|uniref:hypothetical protein n=1 Tax=Streptomyces sp. NPDC006617 TaxID=3155354 RepID=UPI0033B59E38
MLDLTGLTTGTPGTGPGPVLRFAWARDPGGLTLHVTYDLGARFAPGRLFDVPVPPGRVQQATAYDDLNPTPLFV